MIKVQVKKTTGIDSIIISGHSGYDVEGHDIVCAGVSSIVITTVNAILRLEKNAINYESKSGYVKIDIMKHNEIVDKLIENMLSLLNEMQDKYKKYIEIN